MGGGGGGGVDFLACVLVRSVGGWVGGWIDGRMKDVLVVCVCVRVCGWVGGVGGWGGWVGWGRTDRFLEDEAEEGQAKDQEGEEAPDEGTVARPVVCLQLVADGEDHGMVLPVDGWVGGWVGGLERRTKCFFPPLSSFFLNKVVGESTDWTTTLAQAAGRQAGPRRPSPRRAAL